MKSKITTLILCLCLLACESNATQRKTYEAWMNVNPSVKNLSFEQWQLLRNAKLLPGQIDDSAAQRAADLSAINIGLQMGQQK
jgi:hypothetical protein